MDRPLAVFLLLAAARCDAQYLITTIAGGVPPSTPADALSVSIGDPPRVAVDAAGNVYFGAIHSVFKVDRAGTLTRLAGTGRAGDSGDGGPATGAQFLFPEGIAVDPSGNVFVADRDANRIRRIGSDGRVTAFAGTGESGYSGDNGPALNARFSGPTGLAADAAGSLYVADTNNSVVRRISPDGNVQTVAGNAGQGYGGDGGPALKAVLNRPEGVAIDSARNLYIADTFNHRIRKVSPDGIVTTFAADGFPGYGGDGGPAADATLQLPTDVAVDAAGNVYIADLGTSRVREVTNGIINTVAGSNYFQLAYDGAPPTSVRLSGPTGVAADSAGSFYFTEGSVGSGSGLGEGDFRVWKVAAGVLLVVAGNGAESFSGDGGPASAAQFDSPAGLAFDARGNLFVADRRNNRVRRISPDGNVSTVAGYGPASYLGDGGLATEAALNQPAAVAVSSGGNLFIADTLNNRIRELLPNGNIVTYAGNGNAAFFGDGADRLAAAIHGPQAIVFDAAGNLYIADTGNHRVRRIFNGKMENVAGTGQGFGGDGGLAVNALLNTPAALAFDKAGNLYIADQGNGRVRMVDTKGVITTVASGLVKPQAIAVDPSGAVFVSDGGQNTVFQVSSGGTPAPVAGGGPCCYTGDGGAALKASLDAPWGLVADSNGNLYLADSGNDAIRLLRPAAAGGSGSAVANAASNAAGPIAPGEIITIYGTGLGPAQGVQVQGLDNLGLISTQLGGVAVDFNGISGPVLYASATQVTAIVPYELLADTAQVTVAYQSRIVFTTSVPVAATAPALFTADESGRGQVLAFNQDGSLNGSANPAAPGSIVTMLATGEGRTLPAGVNGKPAGNPAPKPVADVAVKIGGQLATVTYAGGQPGTVEGAMQLNVQVPSGLPAGPSPIVLVVGGVASPGGVTITVAAGPAAP